MCVLDFLKKVKVEDKLVVEAIGKLGAANRARADLIDACIRSVIQQTELKSAAAERLIHQNRVVPSAGSLSNWKNEKHKISDVSALLVSAIEELRIPEYRPTYSDNMRPPVPGYAPSVDVLP